MPRQQPQESPHTRHTVPAPVDDAIDSIVDAVSSGARISPGASDDPSSSAMPAVTLPSTSRRPWARSPAVRRTGPLLIAFAVGLGAAVWGLRSFESIDRRSAPSPLPVERETPSASPAVPRIDLLPSRDLRPLTLFASRKSALQDYRRGGSLDPPRPGLKTRPYETDNLATRSKESQGPALEAATLATTTPESIVPISPAPIESRIDAPEPVVTRDVVPLNTAALDAEALDTRAVRATVDDYAEALEQLDVNAAAVLWPSVDRRALGRAFASLKSQTVAFEDCDVELASPTAIARCHGTAEYIVKVGGSAPRTGRFAWLFRMRKRADVWTIEGVSASQAGSLRDQH